MKKAVVFIVMSLICLGLAVSALNFLSSPAYAQGAIFGTTWKIIPFWPDTWICVGNPTDCVMIYPQQ